MKSVSFVGSLVPVFIGTLALALGVNVAVLGAVTLIGGLILVVQAVFSIWSLHDEWANKYMYAIESTGANLDLSNKFRALGQLAANPPVDLAESFLILETKNDARQQQDTKQSVSGKEMRRGHHEALRIFQRPCASCNKVPTGEKASTCPTCGQY